MKKAEKGFLERIEIGRVQLFGILAALISFVVVLMLPTTENFSMAARNTLAVLLAIIFLLVTEVFPIAITCLLAIPLLYFLHCTDSVAGALTGFTNPTLFFVLASFGISEAMKVVPLLRRILLFLMRKFGSNTKKLLFAVMLVTTLLSSIISNVASAAVFIPIVEKFLAIYDNEEDRMRTGKAFMIAIPVASMIGGMMTPAGSSINVLAISILEENAGLTISFVQWMAMGIPLVLVMLPFAWWVCARTFKPAPIDVAKIDAYIKGEVEDLPPKPTAKEKYVLIVLGATLFLWILSSWIPMLNITAIALICLALFCLPGKAKILGWMDYKRCVSIDAFILMGVMISMGSVISTSGLSALISSVIFPSNFPQSTFLGLLFICVLTFLLLLPIPVAPALVAMLSASLIGFSGTVGLSPILAVAAFELCASNCYLLPLDTVPLMTYVTGYYRMFDMPKATWKIQVFMAVVCSAWLALIGGILF